MNILHKTFPVAAGISVLLMLQTSAQAQQKQWVKVETRNGVHVYAVDENGETEINLLHDTTPSGVHLVKDSIPTVEEDTVIVGRWRIIHRESPEGHSYTDIYRIPKPAFQRVFTHWLGIDFGWNNFVDRSDYAGLSGVNPNVKAYDYSAQGLYTFAPRPPSDPLTASEFSLVPEKSVNVNIWIFRQQRYLRNNKIGMEYGLGLLMNNFRYRRNITYVNQGSHTMVIRDSISFRKNKLFTEYLTVPVFLCFHLSGRGDEGFQVKLGSNFGYLFKSRTKQVSDARGKVKTNDNFNLSTFRVSPELALGWHSWSFYVTYSLTPLHQYGVKQYPYAFGIRFNGF
ncbi:MAG: outer membrane beta-barrel protein [Thermoflavifilum aggregans]|nr:outer membrane beta-barrel protein [Thermoflavifilum aggregans]